jgi:RNA polymerase sigma-70 factor (ECF subfamily)
VLSTRLLRMTMTAPVSWETVETRLRPFVERRVSGPDVDDVMQDVFLRMQTGLASLRDEQRFTAWLFQIARSSIAEYARTRARHPLPDGAESELPAAPSADDDRDAARELAGCVSMFVAQLASPYREAVSLVELDGLTTREAADIVGISVSGMKSRVQRGRAQLRRMFDQCCEIALDPRGKPTDYTPRQKPCRACEHRPWS